MFCEFPSSALCRYPPELAARLHSCHRFAGFLQREHLVQDGSELIDGHGPQHLSVILGRTHRRAVNQGVFTRAQAGQGHQTARNAA